MTHPSGIRATVKLVDDLKNVKLNDTRCIQVKIENEALTMIGCDYVNGTFEEDYDSCVKKYLDENECCYIIMRTDEQSERDYNWLFLSWVPDKASVRQKMLYASTRATMKREFGENCLKDDLTGYDPVDLLYQGYKKHVDSKLAPPPLSNAELELLEIKKLERETALDDGHRTLKCMEFPPTEELERDLEKFVAEAVDLVEMSVHVEDEKIHLVSSAKTTDCDDVRSRINPDNPRYFLFRYRHQFEDQQYKSIIFVYNMPGYSASVKDRMLYSSCKGPFLQRLQDCLGLRVDRKLELIAGDLSDLMTDNILLDLHPPKVDNRPSFSKPKGPSNRGPKRLIKDPQ